MCGGLKTGALCRCARDVHARSLCPRPRERLCILMARVCASLGVSQVINKAHAWGPLVVSDASHLAHAVLAFCQRHCTKVYTLGLSALGLASLPWSRA